MGVSEGVALPLGVKALVLEEVMEGVAEAQLVGEAVALREAREAEVRREPVTDTVAVMVEVLEGAVDTELLALTLGVREGEMVPEPLGAAESVREPVAQPDRVAREAVAQGVAD